MQSLQLSRVSKKQTQYDTRGFLNVQVLTPIPRIVQALLRGIILVLVFGVRIQKHLLKGGHQGVVLVLLVIKPIPYRFDLLLPQQMGDSVRIEDIEMIPHVHIYSFIISHFYTVLITIGGDVRCADEDVSKNSLLLHQLRSFSSTVRLVQ